MTGPTRVLLVEDEAVLARLVDRVLTEEGYRVQVEGRGRPALAAAAHEAPDAVILDIGLPDLDGFAVCRELRRGGLRCPILMLTARDAVPDRVRGLDAGADDYLVKPFAFEELLARLRAQLRREGGPRRLEIGAVALDPSSRQVLAGGREVVLTDQEFRLLELLMRHPGVVLTRDRILEHVWGYESDPRSNVVDIYVHYLRRKLGREGSSLIRTIRSAGYMLKP
ncbi:MAG TPA: response regulator transcription factor [Candidatus Acidoferrales bacterium]|nr:response regulator transcription factor [Candidatus Acidoferrales bacterium]